MVSYHIGTPMCRILWMLFLIAASAAASLRDSQGRGIISNQVGLPGRGNHSGVASAEHLSPEYNYEQSSW